MILAIVGGRDFTDYQKLKEELDQYIDQIEMIVSGGATGADTLADRYSKDNEIKFIRFPAQWKTHGKKAGYLRNKDIVEKSNAVVAFWDGESRGTKSTIDLCEKIGRPLKIINY